jgi:hypothetical protein
MLTVLKLYVTSSSDGLTWSAPRQLPNQKGTVPALAVYDSQLVVCYRSSVSNQMYWTRSSDGSNWRFEVMPFQAASGFPSMTVISGTGGISQLLLVCAASAAGSQLLQSIYTPSSGWAALAPIVSQSAQSVSLTTTSDGAAFMTYLGMGSPAQYYASTSTDGIKWTFSPIDNQIGNTPACYIFQGRTYMVYTSPGSPGQLNVTSAQGSIIAPFPPILNPTQSDLANCGSDPNFWININDAQWRAGNQPGANTLYYAIQQDATHWYIHYLFLYAGQRGQTVRSLFPLAQFNAQLWSVGEHPGDLERVMMKLNKSPDGTSVASIEGVQYEAHGNFHDYTFDQVDWIDGTHALVSVALNNHSNWNEKIEGSPVADNNIPLVALIGNFLGGSFGDTSIMWNPYSDAGTTFTELGIDADGKPINDQIWATFLGRMGDSYVTSLKGGSSFGGVDLSTFDWGYVETIWSIAVAKGIVSGGLLHADGPGGPGGRAWVTPLSS